VSYFCLGVSILGRRLRFVLCSGFGRFGFILFAIRIGHFFFRVWLRRLVQLVVAFRSAWRWCRRWCRRLDCVVKALLNGENSLFHAFFADLWLGWYLILRLFVRLRRRFPGFTRLNMCSGSLELSGFRWCIV
jgi:hypothetical protein